MLKRRAFMSTATLIPAAILSDAVAARPVGNTEATRNQLSKIFGVDPISE